MESHISMWDELARKINTVFKKFGINFAIIGTVAGTKYGLHVTTDDIDILLNKNDKSKVRSALNKIVVEDQISIDLINSDDISGDGLTGDPNKSANPEGLPFQEPDKISNLIGGVPYLTLSALVEYKLSSGLYGTDREEDFKHVRFLIKANNLDINYGDNFRTDLRDLYRNQWEKIKKGSDYNSDRLTGED